MARLRRQSVVIPICIVSTNIRRCWTHSSSTRARSLDRECSWSLHSVGEELDELLTILTSARQLVVFGTGQYLAARHIQSRHSTSLL